MTGEASVPRRSVVDAAIGRRRLCGLGLLSVAALVSPSARAAVRSRAPRSLGFHNTHTGERLATIYWADGRYRPDALAEINWILRDFRTGDVVPIDLRLLDLLHELRRRTGGTRPFEVISGYRSPATNAMLASRSGGVARNSFHMRGIAIDVRLPGCDLEALRDAAIRLVRGGVGYYPSSDFVHLDVGPVRSW